MLAAMISVLSAFLLVIWSGLQPISLSYAADFNAYDKTTIEEDLREVDVSKYPKNANGKHCLLDDVGFMEYGFSKSSFIAENYFGIYFYVYNPTEKAVSERSGANFVNMAVEYGADGEPTKYENCAITPLSHTSNHRFYKFKLTKNADVYARVSSYSNDHEGKRRYDIGSIQLWFSGEKNATDSFVGEDGISYTYYCTGYAAGCGVSGSDESTLSVDRKKLETISLDIHSTWYRTDFTENYDTATTLSSVYFAVPNRYMEEFGQLQIVKAEWFEYKTNWIFVTNEEGVEKAIKPYLGETLPKDEQGNYFDDSIPFECYHYIGPSDSGQQGLGYNKKKSYPQIERLDWLIRTEEEKLSKTISPNVLKDYANSYEIYQSDKVLQIGEKKLNAHLFSDEVDEGHTKGYNVHEFDARNKEDWIDLKIKETTNVWENFLNMFRPNNQHKTFLTAKNILPIEEITVEQLSGENAEISQKVFVDESEVEALKNYQKDAAKNKSAVFMLRFSTSEYNTLDMEFHPDTDWTGWQKKNFYAARDTVYLDFDIIHLGFVKGDETTIIPVVASPIDIYPALTPPPSIKDQRNENLIWWLVGIAAGTLVCAIIAELARKG